MGLLSSLFGCAQTNSQKDKAIELKEIEVKYDEQDGFKDINLTITSEEKTNDRHIYLAKGLYNGKVVGLKFEVLSNMPNGLTENGPNPETGFIKNALVIKSIGSESDEFLEALSELYGFPTNQKFKSTIYVPTIFSLNKQNVNLEKAGYFHFKAFLDEDNESNYCEFFFNVDSGKRIIELHEKDMEYRKLIIKAFSQPSH